MISPALEIGEGKGEGFPFPPVVGHRYLGVHLLADIDAVGEILGRSQHQLGRLNKAGVKSDATTITFVADDGFTSDVDLAEVKACADCIVSFRDEGGFTMVMPGFSNKAQVKGVIEIQVK